LAFESAIQIHEITISFPVEEKYALRDQIRRSSRSICANIAEAWRKRRYPKHFISKLSDADSEAAETIIWLEFALRFGYLPETQYKELTDHYDHICRQLTIMMSNPEQWKPKS